MDRDELAFAGAVRQAEMVRRGDVSSRDLVELYLDRIARFDGELNAFRKVMGERALVDAQQADARRGAGDDRPLLGVPIAVKDTEDVGGEVTTLGTAAHSPAATAAPLPPLEPPGLRSVFQGLRVMPNAGPSVSPMIASSGVFVLPITTAPAARSRRTSSLS